MKKKTFKEILHADRCRATTGIGSVVGDITTVAVTPINEESGT